MTANPRRLGKAMLAGGAVLAATATIAAVSGPQSSAIALAPQAAQQATTGATTGTLSRAKLTITSAIKVDLDHEFVRLPLHRGEYHGTTVWYVLTDVSDPGIADELGLNYAPKLGNAGIGGRSAVQDVRLSAATGNTFGEGTIHFAGIPDFSPTRILTPGDQSFPPAKAQPGSVAGKKYSPFIRVKGTSIVYNAPIVATGDGPFDVTHHSNTHDRVLAVHPAAKDTGPAQFHGASVDLLIIRGFDSGKPIIYLSFESDDAATATLERATYVPSLNASPFVGGDDFIGSLRERIFPFVNGRTGQGDEAQGLAHLIKDGHASEDASLGNTALIDALRQGGDALNVQGDFPTLSENNRRASYSPLWEAQFGQWTAKAIAMGLDRRQTDEFQILALAKQRPDLLTGPGGAPYGSVKAQINCPVVGFFEDEPKEDLIAPVPGSAVDFPGAYLQ